MQAVNLESSTRICLMKDPAYTRRVIGPSEAEKDRTDRWAVLSTIYSRLRRSIPEVAAGSSSSITTKLKLGCDSSCNAD